MAPPDYKMAQGNLDELHRRKFRGLDSSIKNGRDLGREKRLETMEKLGIDELYDFVLKRLVAIYNRHRRKYRGNPDSKQMCCMWSTSNPPDTIENTAPILDLEKEFDIYLDEDEAFELYDLLLPEAAKRIIELMRQRMRRTDI